MHQLIYTSEAAAGFSQQDLFRVVEQSARNNPSDDLTGFLVFQNRQFLQLIEGPRLGLEALLTRLRRDTRHQAITILSQRSIAARSFPRWRMHRVAEGSAALEELEAALRSQGSGTALPAVVRDFLDARRAA
jgi:hypothetical protein